MRSTQSVTNSGRPRRQGSTATGARRARLISRIQNQPDAAIPWHIFILKLGYLLNDDPRVDRLLAALVEASPSEIALCQEARLEVGRAGTAWASPDIQIEKGYEMENRNTLVPQKFKLPQPAYDGYDTANIDGESLIVGKAARFKQNHYPVGRDREEDLLAQPCVPIIAPWLGKGGLNIGWPLQSFKGQASIFLSLSTRSRTMGFLASGSSPNSYISATPRPAAITRLLRQVVVGVAR
jgi:hypothetical protein